VLVRPRGEMVERFVGFLGRRLRPGQVEIVGSFASYANVLVGRGGLVPSIGIILPEPTTADMLEQPPVIGNEY
jgi:hypothetical protein